MVRGKELTPCLVFGRRTWMGENATSSVKSQWDNDNICSRWSSISTHFHSTGQNKTRDINFQNDKSPKWPLFLSLRTFLQFYCFSLWCIGCIPRHNPSIPPPKGNQPGERKICEKVCEREKMRIVRRREMRKSANHYFQFSVRRVSIIRTKVNISTAANSSTVKD